MKGHNCAILMLAVSLWGALVVDGSVLAAYSAEEGNAGQAVTRTDASGINKIGHVVWIVQENHSFDNYFGTYPGADGIPPGTCLPVMPGSKRCIAPFHMPEGAPVCDLSHDWQPCHAAMDNGRMDGFVWAEGSPYTMAYGKLLLVRHSCLLDLG